MMYNANNKTSKKALTFILTVSLIIFAGTTWAVSGVISTQKIDLSYAQELAEKISNEQTIPVVVDKAVLGYLNKIVGDPSHRKGMRLALERMENYESHIKEQLAEANMPLELLAVPLVESGYKNKALSPRNARGIWQFIPQTARRCGLTVNNVLDERLNSRRLTKAAICYYGKLNAIFNNWHVVLTAYNSGENAMAQVISQAGHNDILRLGREKKFKWKENNNYLAKVMAAMIILKNPELVE